MVHSHESEEQNQYIRDDKELILAQLCKLKAQRTQARGISQENLVKLTLESNTTLKVLRKIVDKVTKGKGQSEQNWDTWLTVSERGLRDAEEGFLLLPAYMDTQNTSTFLPSHIFNEFITNEFYANINTWNSVWHTVSTQCRMYLLVLSYIWMSSFPGFKQGNQLHYFPLS